MFTTLDQARAHASEFFAKNGKTDAGFAVSAVRVQMPYGQVDVFRDMRVELASDMT